MNCMIWNSTLPVIFRPSLYRKKGNNSILDWKHLPNRVRFCERFGQSKHVKKKKKKKKSDFISFFWSLFWERTFVLQVVCRGSSVTFPRRESRDGTTLASAARDAPGAALGPWELPATAPGSNTSPHLSLPLSQVSLCWPRKKQWAGKTTRGIFSRRHLFFFKRQAGQWWRYFWSFFRGLEAKAWRIWRCDLWHCLQEMQRLLSGVCPGVAVSQVLVHQLHLWGASGLSVRRMKMPLAAWQKFLCLFLRPYPQYRNEQFT